MSVFEARISFVLFIGIFAITSLNALYFQPAIGHGFQTSLKISPPRNNNTKLVRDIQYELIAKNYSPGNIMGRLSLQTSSAIIAYEHDHSLPLTGQSSSKLLKHMLFTQSEKESKREPTFYVKQLQKVVQTSLVHLERKSFSRANISSGKPLEKSGELTPLILRFEKKWALPITGRISGRLIHKISQLTGDETS